MKHYKIQYFLILLFLSCVNLIYAQDWNSNDSIKTIGQAENRIDDFRNNMKDLTGQDLLDESFPNSWPIFGDKARMSIGGYAKLDYVQDFNGMYDKYQVTIRNVPVPGDGRPLQSGYMNMFARESRFNIDYRATTKAGSPIRVFVELDFYNLDRDAFNQTPRLRHFYGVLGRLLIGRTWGTQSDFNAIATTLDFGGGDAINGTRRAQVRWEDHFNETYSYAVALEMLEYQGIETNGQPGQASPNSPLLAGRITKTTKNKGRLMLGASIFQLRWDPEAEEQENETAFAWGVSLSGREYFGEKRHFLYFLSSYGNGWGSNIISLLRDGSATLTPEGKLDTRNAFNMGFGFNYNISPVVVTSISANWLKLDPSEFRDANAIKSGGSAHANIIWSPLKRVNAGIEYIFARRTNVDDKVGDAHRLQAMIKYILN